MPPHQLTLAEALGGGAPVLPPPRAYFLRAPLPSERNAVDARLERRGVEFAGPSRHPFVVCRTLDALQRFSDLWPDPLRPPAPAASIPRSHDPRRPSIRALQRADLAAERSRALAPGTVAHPAAPLPTPPRPRTPPPRHHRPPEGDAGVGLGAGPGRATGAPPAKRARPDPVGWAAVALAVDDMKSARELFAAMPRDVAESAGIRTPTALARHLNADPRVQRAHTRTGNVYTTNGGACRTRGSLRKSQLARDPAGHTLRT